MQELRARNRVILENPLISQKQKFFHASVEREGSYPYTQKPITSPQYNINPVRNEHVSITMKFDNYSLNTVRRCHLVLSLFTCTAYQDRSCYEIKMRSKTKGFVR
jgi:hypothetical protein